MTFSHDLPLYSIMIINFDKTVTLGHADDIRKDDMMNGFPQVAVFLF